LASSDQLWAGWQQEGDDLVQAKRDAVRVAVSIQEEAGIDIVSDGEQTRQHFVTTFIEGLNGVDSVNRATVQIRQRYDASVPRVVGEVTSRGGVFVDDVRFLRSITDRRIKTQLPGPMTMVDTLQDDYYDDRPTLAMVFAGILNEEAKAMAAAGVDVIQFDEPAFNVFLDDVAGWGIEALERAIDEVETTTAVHICYGYGVRANIEWKHTLGQEWRQYEATFPVLAESSIDQVSLEIAGSHVPLEMLDLLGDKSIQAGVIDVAIDRIETPEEVAATLDAVSQHMPLERVVASTNCGMVPLDREVALAKMRVLAEGASMVC
jgi:5-methyltetrahydropteroyltriglutamate--homocysteine methyltransferase